ncbi:MAG: hypothetical protein WAU16_09000 [Rhizobiaceae bacterium]
MPERINPVGFKESFIDPNTLGVSPLAAFGGTDSEGFTEVVIMQPPVEAQTSKEKVPQSTLDQLYLVRDQAIDMGDEDTAHAAQDELDRLYVQV